MIYRVDYLVKDKVKFNAAVTPVPTYVVADDFDGALKQARKFENDNVSLYECAIQLGNGSVTIARGFKGLSASKAEEVESV